MLNSILSEAFNPPVLIRGAPIQTFLASFRLRAVGHNPMVSEAHPKVLETHKRVRLLGSFSPVRGTSPRGLVVLIHGWEGSADSTYVRTTGKLLYRNGYHMFRLNLRDHGESHHLNKGLFFATRFEEVFQAVREATHLAGVLPVFIVGFSLGGNFALRIAKYCEIESIPHLRHIVSISPVLDPNKATDKIDANPVILRYFLKKWTRSLKKKQQLFPDEYNFENALGFRTLRKVTDILLPSFTDFSCSKDYFRAYSVLGNDLIQNPVPTTIITAEDDPIIPVEDFYRLQLNPDTNLVVHRHGGHQGFVESFSMKCWYERKILELFNYAVANEV